MDLSIPYIDPAGESRVYNLRLGQVRILMDGERSQRVPASSPEYFSEIAKLFPEYDTAVLGPLPP